MVVDDGSVIQEYLLLHAKEDIEYISDYEGLWRLRAEVRYILTSHRVLIFVQGKYDMGDITEELNEEICWEELVTNKK